MSAIADRRRRLAFGASANQGKAGPQTVRGDQEAEGRPRRRGEDRRGHQGALHAAVSGVTDGSPRRESGHRRTPMRMALTRRDILAGSTAAAAVMMFASPLRAQAPA